MIIDNNGKDFIKKLEGWRNHPYLDSANVPTIGYGFTYYKDGTRVTMQDSPMTLKEGDELIESIIPIYEDAVHRQIKVKLTQNQYTALVSFTYNLGEGNLKSSTLLKKININPCDLSITAEFKKWIYSDGKKSKGLKKRRNQEAFLYFS